MQQNLIWKTQQALIYQNLIFFLKKSDLANLNLEVNKLDTDKLKKETKQFKQFEK